MKRFRRRNLQTWCTVTVVYSIVSSFLIYGSFIFVPVDCCCAFWKSFSHVESSLWAERVLLGLQCVQCTYLSRCFIRWLFNFIKSPLTVSFIRFHYITAQYNMARAITENSFGHLHRSLFHVQFMHCVVVMKMCAYNFRMKLLIAQ